MGPTIPRSGERGHNRSGLRHKPDGTIPCSRNSYGGLWWSMLFEQIEHWAVSYEKPEKNDPPSHTKRHEGRKEQAAAFPPAGSVILKSVSFFSSLFVVLRVASWITKF
ncbi:MAG: hypothetical protein R2856_00235 [Caldilineaceae bacterium]